MFQAISRILILSGALVLCFAQSTTMTIDQACGGDRNVAGKASPGSAPITIYEINGQARNFLGSGKSMDGEGYFAVPVTPLKEGTNIIAVDREGKASALVLVVKRTGPAAEN